MCVICKILCLDKGGLDLLPQRSAGSRLKSLGTWVEVNSVADWYLESTKTKQM